MFSLLLSLAFAAAPAAQEPEVRAPGPAPALQVFAARSAAGLGYLWWVPEGYDGKQPRNLTVILHGTGLDRRWGPANNPPGAFRPGDIVVSVDGTSPGQGDSRLFLGEERDADAFAAFLAEMRKSFAVDRVFLYGHSQGGFFVVYFAGLHPEAVAGVVAHASGAWNWSETGKKARPVAIAFMHGTADPVVPYLNSSGSWRAYADAGFERLLLRRLPGYNHWPNPVRATECLDWCEAMTTDDPDRALKLAKELLRPKGEDAFGYEIPPAFAAARMVLRRFAGEGPAPFGGLPSALQDHAGELTSALEKLAAEVAEDLARDAGKKPDLRKEPPIAALCAFREDFRGVDAAERWYGKFASAKAQKAALEAGRRIFSTFHDEKLGDGEKLARIVAALEDGWLSDDLPAELAVKLAEWRGQAESLGLDKKDLAAYDEIVEPWLKGHEERVLERYFQSCSSWKLPK